MTAPHDVIVVGGGIMGAASSIRLAQGGMRVLLLEADSLGLGASGINAGTLSLQIKRVDLMPYALRGHHLWKKAGDLVGYHEVGGLSLAFTDHEAAILTNRMTARARAGAPIELIDSNQARAHEPRLSANIKMASWCAADAYANSSLTGRYYRGLLEAAGVDVHERRRAHRIDATDSQVVVETATDQRFTGSRLLLATGAWTKAIAALLGVDLPIRARINTVSVTERMPRLFHSIIGHATGLLTLKQSANGTVLIGGGWQGTGTPDTGRGAVAIDSLIHNVRLASSAIPSLATARLVRSWTGFEANTPDFFPLAGLLPGHSNVFVLAAVRGGYTIGPFIGSLMGDFILGREPELPLFDPARFQIQRTLQ